MPNLIYKWRNKHKNHNNITHLFEIWLLAKIKKACLVKDVEGLELSHTADKNVKLYKTV